MAEVVQLRPGVGGPHERASLPAAPAHRLVRSPEISELRAFCAAVDLGSIGRAARLLHVTQPALSKRLRSLEAVAGAKLLDRSTRGVAPTAAGTHLYRSARQLLADADAVEALMCGFSRAATPARVAASPTIAECWLPGVLVGLEAAGEHHVSVEVTSANSATARTMVGRGAADMAIAALDVDGMPDEGVRETVVCDDEVVVAVPPSHRWAQASEIEAEDFARTPIIQRDPGAHSSRIVAVALESIGLSPAPPLAQIGSTAAARSAAIAENVPLLLSRMALSGESELLARRVSGLRFERAFALVLAGSTQDLSPGARHLANHLLAEASGEASASPVGNVRNARRG